MCHNIGELQTFEMVCFFWPTIYVDPFAHGSVLFQTVIFALHPALAKCVSVVEAITTITHICHMK